IGHPISGDIARVHAKIGATARIVAREPKGLAELGGRAPRSESNHSQSDNKKCCEDRLSHVRSSLEIYRLARRKEILPTEVRTFRTGPPPFKLPSAVFEPHSPPSLATRISEKSERMLWPLAISMEARMVMFKLGVRYTTMSPAEVSRTESVRSPPEDKNFATMPPAPVSARAEGTPFSSMLPPPVSA